MKRIILEMGMGMDVHGGDYMKAARRAIHDAIRHSSISMFKSLDLDSSKMEVRVTIGVQDPSKLDCDALAEELPRGVATVHAAFGGQNVAEDNGEAKHIIATAAIEAFYPIDGSDWMITGK